MIDPRYGKMRESYEHFVFHSWNMGKSEDSLSWIPTKFHRYLCQRVQKFVEDREKGVKILIISTPPQHGKLLADETPVLTRDGWKNHGDLVVGDEVLNHKGSWVKVTHVFSKGYANCKVSFTNGEEIICHENHEWFVYDRDAHKERILETKAIAKRISHGSQEKKRGHRYNIQLPIKDFATGDEKELPVQPYVLGAWLGDGTNTAGHICACQDDRVVLDEVRNFYPKGKEWTHKKTGVVTASFNGLCKDLQQYGMCYSRRKTDKHIPVDYITASVEQRLELLAGLIDTDGYLYKKANRIVFTTADEKLKDSFEELVATFGWRTTTCECKPIKSTSGIVGKSVYWQIGFNPTCEIPCRIKRKQINIFSKQRKIAFCGVEQIEPVRGNCIEVEGGIYLCGRTMIPTHNSATVSQRLGAWYLLNNPDHHVILISYGDVLAKRFGKQNLNTLKTFAPFFDVELDPTRATSQDMYLKNHDGYMISRGYGAGLTGYSGDLIIIDDPVKNAEEAASEANRESKWEDFLQTIMTRQQSVTRIVLIMTRWHEDDLAGRIKQDMADMVEVVNIPCECESDDDLLGRKIGEPLCPELGKDEKWLKTTKKAYVTENGQRAWDALYQGRPTAMEGNLFLRDAWGFYDREEYKSGKMKFDRVVMSVDATYKDAKRSDFVSIQVIGKTKDDYYLLDRTHKRMTFMNTVKEVVRMKNANPLVRQIYIEDKANGSAIIDVLKQYVSGVVAVEPRESKYARAEAVAHIQQDGHFFLPKKTGWVYEYINEFAVFPNGAHDDDVDAMTQALNKLRKYRKRQFYRKLVDPFDWGITETPLTEIGERIDVI